MRVLVTGHKGYIGSIMVPMLQEKGYEVVGFDNDFFNGCTFGNYKISDIPYVKKDIRNIQKSDLQKCDAIIHLCALSNDPLGYFNPLITDEINHRASIKLAKLAKKAGVQRYMYASTCSIYGASKDDMVNEKSKPHPVTPYAVSKVRTEKDVSKLANTNFSPTFLRSSTAYGISPMLRLDLVLNNLVAWAYTTGEILLKSDGMAWRPIVHVEDMCRAFIAVLEAPRYLVHKNVFNVGINHENFRVKTLAEIVKDVVPNSKIEYAKNAEPDKRSYKVNFDKISQVLPNFKPKWNAYLGAKQLYNAYKKYDLNLEKFEGPKYKRISQIEKEIKVGNLDKNLRWI